MLKVFEPRLKTVIIPFQQRNANVYEYLIPLDAIACSYPSSPCW